MKSILMILSCGFAFFLGYWVYEELGFRQDPISQVPESIKPAPKPVFTPKTMEFILEDGTPCVMVWTRATHFPRAGESGISCNWNYNVQGH